MPSRYALQIYSYFMDMKPLILLFVRMWCCFIFDCLYICSVVVSLYFFLHSLMPDTQLRVIENMHVALLLGCMVWHACSEIRWEIIFIEGISSKHQWSYSAWDKQGWANKNLVVYQTAHGFRVCGQLIPKGKSLSHRKPRINCERGKARKNYNIPEYKKKKRFLSIWEPLLTDHPSGFALRNYASIYTA